MARPGHAAGSVLHHVERVRVRAGAGRGHDGGARATRGSWAHVAGRALAVRGHGGAGGPGRAGASRAGSTRSPWTRAHAGQGRHGTPGGARGRGAAHGAVHWAWAHGPHGASGASGRGHPRTHAGGTWKYAVSRCRRLNIIDSCVTLHWEEVPVPGMAVEGLTTGPHDGPHHAGRAPAPAVPRPHGREPGPRPHQRRPGRAGRVVRGRGPQGGVLKHGDTGHQCSYIVSLVTALNMRLTWGIPLEP